MMKETLLLPALCAALSCQAQPPSSAAEPALPASAANALKPPPGRCTAPRFPVRATAGYEKLSVVVRYTVKANGSVENIRVEGKAPREYKRALASSFESISCQPAEADQEYAADFKYWSS